MPDDITEDEVRRSIWKLKSGKSSGVYPHQLGTFTVCCPLCSPPFLFFSFPVTSKPTLATQPLIHAAVTLITSMYVCM